VLRFGVCGLLFNGLNRFAGLNVGAIQYLAYLALSSLSSLSSFIQLYPAHPAYLTKKSSYHTIITKQPRL